MHKDLKIYIDRLTEEDSENIFEVVPSEFLDIHESELHFDEKVTISGQTYLAKNHLILDLKIQTKVKLPCSICNDLVDVPLVIDDFTHTVELDEIKSAIYDFSEEVRISILLKIPQFLECNHGHCPNRKTVNKFLKQPSEDTYSPFKELSSL